MLRALSETSAAEIQTTVSGSASHAFRHSGLALIVLSVANASSAIDGAILSLLREPIQARFQLSDFEFSILQGPAFIVFGLFAMILAGWLADRTPRKYILGIGIVLWSAMTAAVGIASTFTHLMITRIGFSAGKSTLTPVAYSMVPDMFDRDRLALALAVFSAGASLATGLVFLFGGAITGMMRVQPILDFPLIGALPTWQIVLLTLGIPGVVLGILVSFNSSPAMGAGIKAKHDSGDVVRFFRANRKIMSLLLVGYSGVALLMVGFLTWGPSILSREHGIDISTVGFVMGLAVGLGGSTGIICGGAMADFWLRRGKSDAHISVTVVSLLTAFPVALAITLSDNVLVAVIGLSAIFFFVMAPIGSGIAALLIIAPPRSRGRVSAVFIGLVHVIGQAVGPVAVAGLTDYVFGSKAMVDRSLLVVTIVVLPISASAFLAARGLVGERVRSLNRDS